MFALNNSKKNKLDKERKLKIATIAVGAATIGIYIIFMLLMILSKFGILSVFIHTKPVINTMPVSEDYVYGLIDNDFYNKRLNWIYDEDYYKLYFVYDHDLNNDDFAFDGNSFSKFGWRQFAPEESLSPSFLQKYDLDEYQDIEYYGSKTQGNFANKIENLSFEILLNMLDTHEGIIKIPYKTIVFCSFGIFMLISAALKVITIASSNNNKKLEFSDRTVFAKISFAADILGLIVLTYVFFWLLLWDAPIFYNVTEPSLTYYLLFALPIIVLSVLFSSLYCSAAYYEEKGKSIIKGSQQRSNIVYCKKCGEPINNSAVLCEKCSNEDTIPESSGIHTENRFISTNKHQGITLITGLVYIIVGIITAIISAISFSVVFAVQLSEIKALVISANPCGVLLTWQLLFNEQIDVDVAMVLYYASIVPVLFIYLFFGIGIILKKRWAVLTVKVLMIIGVVFNVLLIVILLALKAFSIVLWINIAHAVAVIFLTSAVARSLSDEPQRFRRRLQEREASAFQK